MRSATVFVALFLFALLFSGALAEEAAKPHPTHQWSNEIPDSKRKNLNLPDGLVHGEFESSSMKLPVGYAIYLPEAYQDETERSFPVVLHLHGGRPGDETKSIRLAPLIDDAIKRGVIQPTIYVFPNGGPMSWYDYPQFVNGSGETVLIEELIPHLKKTYRTREFAIEGFSQGGRGTTRIMLKHPELFVSAAPGGSGYAPEKRVQENDGAESEKVVFASGYNTWDLLDEYAKRADKDALPILLWVGTKGFNYPGNQEYAARLKELGVPFEWIEGEGVDHSAYRMYESQGDAIMQFHQRFFAKP
ncbi:MAG: alpha/beta hydrolase-fold protein [Verrucomicrobiota bacterium]